MVGTDLVEIIAPSALAYKVLSPSAGLLGKELEGWTERRLQNLRNIGATLEHKFGVDDLDTPGELNPRVIRGLLDEGSYIEDDVATEYFAGVVAGSRSDDGKDDSGVTLIEVRTAYRVANYVPTMRCMQRSRRWWQVAVTSPPIPRRVVGDVSRFRSPSLSKPSLATTSRDGMTVTRSDP